MVPVTCKLCSALGATPEYWTLDDRKTHAQFHAFQSGCVSENGDRPSVKEMFGKCFPSDDFEKSTKIDKNRSTLFEICKHIIADKKTDSNSIQCQVCGSNVRYVDKNDRRVTVLILRHACGHSSKKPLACRQCKHESASKSDIVIHVKKFHQIASPISGSHFDENWLVCFDEVKESLAKSFGGLNSVPRLSTPPIELSIQRRLVFKKIYLKRASTAKKIRCNQCQNEIYATCRYRLENHIRVHLQHRIFKCAMCDVTFIYKRNILRHLTKKHGVHPNGNYIDHSDEHHEAIMELVKKCYGKEDDK